MDRKTALVTGGGRGIGRAIVSDLARDSNVACHYNSTTPKDLPANVLPLQANLTKDGACQTLIDETIKAFGRIDVIVNNAGIVETNAIGEFDAAKQLEMLHVNLLAPGNLLACALPHLTKGAAIINISSINATLPPTVASIYAASKAGLNTWTRAMAKELGPKGIRVNAIAPGVIENTDRPRPDNVIEDVKSDTALGRVGDPAQIASVVRFLASDQSDHITGEIITVSGGYRL